MIHIHIVIGPIITFSIWVLHCWIVGDQKFSQVFLYRFERASVSNLNKKATYQTS